MFRSFANRRVLVASVCAALSVALAAGVVLAGAPLAGTADYAFTPNSTLYYKYSGTYDGWAGAKAAVDTVLQTEWANRSYNASALPKFAYSSTGKGTVVFTTDVESPCSNVNNTAWLACAKNWGSTSWLLYIREFGGSGRPTWVWNETGGCGTGETCWDLSRSLIHEAIHITLGVDNHDESGEDKTVMSKIQIAKATDGWNTNHLQPCDEATGQLMYGLYATNARFAGCMNEVADTPGNGLTTTLVLDRASATVCTTNTLTVKGSLKTANLTSYRLVKNLPLDDRTVNIYRRVAGGTWPTTAYRSIVATAATDWNLSTTFSNASTVTYEYKFEFPESDGTRLDEGLTGASDSVTVYWKASPCPV